MKPIFTKTENSDLYPQEEDSGNSFELQQVIYKTGQTDQFDLQKLFFSIVKTSAAFIMITITKLLQ